MKKSKNSVSKSLNDLVKITEYLNSYSINNNNVFHEEVNSLNSVKASLQKHITESMNEKTRTAKSNKKPCIMFGHSTI